MKVLHTSDWHLGQNFMFKDRKREHQKFLNWLHEIIVEESADVLIVAGDIFDTIAPPNYALEMYYRFLSQVSRTTACQVVIVGGNHDSVSTLNAPKHILEVLKVHVIGGITDDIHDEIIVIKTPAGDPSAIICAVPFLRDRNIRKSLPGESYMEKSQALVAGIKNHYLLAKDAAEKIQQKRTNTTIPILATGHLFTEGGEVRENDGIREIHVGSLGHVSISAFPKEFDYVALGHLHRPQKVGGMDHVRYSGSPIPLSFSEAGTTKQIACITFEKNNNHPEIRTIPIPEFQKLRTVQGNLDEVLEQLTGLRTENKDDPVWTEVSVMEETWRPDIENAINQLADEQKIDILAIKNLRSSRDRRLKQNNPTETLADHTPESVFQRRLENEKDMNDLLQQELMHGFHEITNAVNQDKEEIHENS